MLSKNQLTVGPTVHKIINKEMETAYIYIFQNV